jgi:hypothetical protein
MTDEQTPPQVPSVRPIGRVKRAPGFFENPIVQDIIGGFIIPLVKGSVLAIVERALYGEQGAPGPGPSLGVGRTSYQSHLQQKQMFPVSVQQTRFQNYQKVRSQFPQLEDLAFRNEEEATIVVNALYDRIERTSYASVADLYEIVGLKVPDFTYVQFGWSMVQLAQYELRQLPAGGVLLVLPRPFPLQS